MIKKGLVLLGFIVSIIIVVVLIALAVYYNSKQNNIEIKHSINGKLKNNKTDEGYILTDINNLTYNIWNYELENIELNNEFYDFDLSNSNKIIRIRKGSINIYEDVSVIEKIEFYSMVKGKLFTLLFFMTLIGSGCFYLFKKL